MLTACLVWVWHSSDQSAHAVIGDRSDYLAVTGAGVQGDHSVLWIFDTRTESLIATIWDQSIGTMRTLNLRQVSADIDASRLGR